MSFTEITKDLLNKVLTENGDTAYETSGSYCLDYFALIGGMRFNIDDAITLFIRAFFENRLIATKLLFYTRDIREGLGERTIFRTLFNMLSNMYPDIAKQLIEYIPMYGRYDDLLCAFNTPIKKDVVALIKATLASDVAKKKEGQAISLMAKWLPSINTSNQNNRSLACELAKALNLSKEDYRKMLSFLRKGLIIENDLREKAYDFDYSKLPGGAYMKYQNAFLTNDKERYVSFIDSVRSGKKKINSSTLYPYEVIRKLESYHYYDKDSKDNLVALDTIWNSFDRSSIDSRTIVVRDGSGSMLDDQPVSASSVATSLAILFSEMLTGEFHNKFITFSSSPRFVELHGKTIYEKFKETESYFDYTNTNIAKVYQLILDVYSHKDFIPEDKIERILIISDMQFDEIDEDKSTYDIYKEKFEALGFNIPEIVFWNVRARNIQVPTKLSDKNVKLVSGASPKLFDIVATKDNISSYDLMVEVLEKYSIFDTIKF